MVRQEHPRATALKVMSAAGLMTEDSHAGRVEAVVEAAEVTRRTKAIHRTVPCHVTAAIWLNVHRLAAVVMTTSRRREMSAAISMTASTRRLEDTAKAIRAALNSRVMARAAWRTAQTGTTAIRVVVAVAVAESEVMAPAVQTMALARTALARTAFAATAHVTRVAIDTKVRDRKVIVRTVAGLRAIALKADESTAAVRRAAVRRVAVTKAIDTKAIARKAVVDDAAATTATPATLAADEDAGMKVLAAAEVRAGTSAVEAVAGIAECLAEAARFSPRVKLSKARSKVSWNCIPGATGSFVNLRKTMQRKIQIHLSPAHSSKSTSCGKVY